MKVEKWKLVRNMSDNRSTRNHHTHKPVETTWILLKRATWPGVDNYAKGINVGIIISAPLLYES